MNDDCIPKFYQKNICKFVEEYIIIIDFAEVKQST